MWSSAEKKRFDGPAFEDAIEQPFAIPHSLSAGSGTLLHTGIPEKRTLDGNIVQLSNGCWNIGGNTLEPLSTKVAEHRPSYLGISCAVNGYTSYSQFCRSRDSSPARISPRSSAPLATSPSSRLKVEPILEARAGGGRELPNGRHHGPPPQEATAGACTSLVQQRIAALYGTEAAERVARSRTRTAKSPLKLESALSKRSPSCPAQVVRGRSKSPPVFRHLTRDFKEHLRLSEVSASPAENLPGFVVGGRSLASPEKRPAFSGPLHIIEVDRGDSSALKEEILEESRNYQVVNGGGVLKLNGNHELTAAIDEVDKAVELPYRPVTGLQPQSLLSPVSVKALSSSDLPAREGHAFLDTTLSTQQALESRIREAELDLDVASISEDMKGRIRAAIGKANLLINKKFKQFRELCLKNIEQNLGDPFPTTGSDLAGFWDMVMLQVENVNALFEELNVLKANNWVEPEKTESTKVSMPRPTRKVASRSVPASPKRSEKAEEAAKSRLEARKRLMEAKRQARQQQQSQAVARDEDVAIFVPQEKGN